MDLSLAGSSRRGSSVARVRAGVIPSHRVPHVVLFLLLAVVFAYTPPRWQDWNQNSRFNLTRAIVEQHTVRIDAYAGNTGDYATIDGHIYSDKAPGLALAAVPVYAATLALRPLGFDWVTQRLARSESFASTLTPGGEDLSTERVAASAALYVATLLCVAVPAALMLALLALLVERLWGCRTAGIITALIIGLATPVFTYAQAFYGHVPAAAALIAAFATLALRPPGMLSRNRLLAVGFFLGLSVLIEYPAALAGLPIALWALARARQRAVIYGLLGALPPLAVLAAYDLIAFGTPLPVGYEHSTLWQPVHQQGFLSITYPKWAAIWGLTGSAFRGLFYYSPVLLLALAGAYLGLRDRRQRPAVVVALAAFALTFLFVSSSAMWWGGFAVGPRYVLPGVPFLAIPLGAAIAWINSRAIAARLAGLATVAALAGMSILLVWLTTFAGQGYPPDTIRDPLAGYVLPAIRDGAIARNAGMALGLSGVTSLVPLLILLIAGLACLGWTMTHSRKGSP